MSSLDTTPGRKTRLFLDIPETVLIADAWTFSRRGADINALAQSGQSAAVNRANVKFWASGVWTLAPVQHDLANVAELSANRDLIIGPDDVTTLNILIAAGTTALVAEENTFRRQNDIPDMEYRAGVLEVGDPFFTKRLPAGASAANSLLTAGRPAPDVTSSVAPMDAVAVGKTTYPPNQGFVLRFTIPGTARSAANYVFGFHFGQYVIYLRGTGLAELWEYCHDAGGAEVTRQRAQFRFCDAGRVANTSHALTIFPHTGPRGEKYIICAGARVETSLLSTGATVANAAEGEFLYVADAARRGTDADESPGAATAAGVIRLDIRRDQKPKIQISRLGFSPAGTLIDLPPPASLPPLLGDVPTAFRLETTGLGGVDGLPSVNAVVPSLLDSKTRQYFRPGLDSSPYAVFNFTGDLDSTPFLWAYTVARPETTERVTPGAFEVPTVRAASLSGCSDDPTLTTASCRVSDLSGQMTRLHQRGLFAAKIVVDAEVRLPGAATATTVPVVLHQGYVNRPLSARRGRQLVRRDGTRPPYPNWRDYDLSLLSMAMRLQEAQAGSFDGSFAQDETATPDPVTKALPPWKVTDKIRTLLSACGFASEQIAIPDLPARLWPGHDLDTSALTLRAYSDLSEEIITTARNYLGAYVIWNENAGMFGDYGPEGRWELLFGTKPNADPIWNFVTRAQRENVPPNLPAAYEAQTTWVAPGSSEQVIPPEFNAVTVIANALIAGTNKEVAFANHAYNPKSCNFPGFTTRADPTHPDWLGRLRPTKIIDYSLAGGSDEQSQRAVDWTVRRLYDFCCHAQRIRHFVAPLVFVFDEAIQRFRPLRFQDPVNYRDGDGKPVRYIVKSVNPQIKSDKHQMAEYELIRPIDDQPGSAQGFLGRSGVAFLRRATQVASLKAHGGAGVASLLSAGSTAPHAEKRAKSAPLYTPTQKPLQDAYGRFYYLDGYDDPTDTSLPRSE